MKCPICSGHFKRLTKHHKDYNKNNDIKSNIAYICYYCHQALHRMNKKNSLDWDYIIKNKINTLLKEREVLKNRNKTIERRFKK